MANRAFVLLSGGVCSAVALRIAMEEYPGNVEAMWLDYVVPQHHVSAAAAAALCNRLGVVLEERILIDLYRPLQDMRMIFFGTWHALQAVGHIGDHSALYWGAHTEFAPGGYPPTLHNEYIAALTTLVHVSTHHRVSLHTPLQWTSRAEIVRLGARMGVDFALTWSCQANGPLHCGRCPPCHARKQAFGKSELMDPAEYEPDHD